ncbi:cardiolipin synthase [Lacrimispora sp. NSJ-141]|uniref:Cardiolipin synthase n=1 Tax=Lientehia hominis TaxID=2897778 RepID=A0AAP2RGV2_9FIRM|nr:cardiolipin synthase [Lientehia hominis]MCD2491013.1 cardiolipin synthase [Lientehia hominis]
MKYKKLITNRILITGLLLIIQVVWMAILLLKLGNYSVWINIAFSVLSVLIVLYIIGKDENSAYKIAWIILILCLPLFGGLLYLCFGNKNPSKKMRKRLELEHRRLEKEFQGDDMAIDEIRALDERASGVSTYLKNTSDYTIYKDTDSKYYPVGELMFKDMLEALEKAEYYIFMEYFIIEEGVMWNKILEILERKVSQGVDVRLIYDDMGCVALLPGSYAKILEKKGIKCMAFNPFVPFLSMVMNHRDHRKIMVIDGHTAFTGGINLSDEYINLKQRFGHWKDTGVRLVGEAVWNFTLMFLEMWNAYRKEDRSLEQYKTHVHHPKAFTGSGYVQPFGDSPLDNETVAENVYIEILNQARHYCYIFTPYLIVDNEMKTALSLAAKRGVDVRIVTPGIPDKPLVFRLTRSNYAPLLRAGVKIYEYTPGFIHAKSYVCDDEFAVVGTINMDYRSLYLHFECGTFMYRTEAVMDLKMDAVQTIGKSRPVSLRECRTGIFGGLLDSVLRILAPLF